MPRYTDNLDERAELANLRISNKYMTDLLKRIASAARCYNWDELPGEVRKLRARSDGGELRRSDGK